MIGSIKDSDSILKRLYPSKESIKSQLIDVDELIPEIDKDSFDFDKWINELNDIDKQVKTGTKSWQDYSNGLDNNQKWIAKWGQETEGQIRTQSDLVKANQQARASALAYNEAIKAQTFSAKAGKAALQALATAGNMILFTAITKGIELAGKAFYNYVHRVENAKDANEEFSTSFNDVKSSLDSDRDTITSIASRYNELSQHINNLGANISLTQEEFEEYRNITQQIAEMYPSLVTGYDAQGYAIVNLKDAVVELNAEYEKAKENSYWEMIQQAPDILDNFNTAVYADCDGLNAKLEKYKKILQ